MRWNPCGRFVDLGSRPFKCRYRPFRDSDEEVEIEWKPCAPGALVLPYTSCISNPFWERDQFEYVDGLLPLDTVEPTGKPKPIPGSGVGHMCGTEQDFEEGGIYDPDIPPVVYGASGLPACCNPAVVGGGGDRVGGRALMPFEPGQTCATATNTTLGALNIIRILSGRFAWLRYPIPAPGMTLHVEVSANYNLPNGGSQGSVCPGTATGALNFGAGLCQTVFPLVDGPFFWFVFFNDTGTNRTFSIVADEGSC